MEREFGPESSREAIQRDIAIIDALKEPLDRTLEVVPLINDGKITDACLRESVEELRTIAERLLRLRNDWVRNDLGGDPSKQF
jgi:hypothetical protein